MCVNLNYLSMHLHVSNLVVAQDTCKCNSSFLSKVHLKNSIQFIRKEMFIKHNSFLFG